MSTPSKKTGTSVREEDRERSVSADPSSGSENTGEDSASEDTKVPAAIPRDPDGIYLCDDEVISIGINARRVADDPGKHKPITKKGTMFHWDANEHISKAPPTLGVKSRAATELTLFDEDGNPATFIYPPRRNLNFANQKEMVELQKWRLQVIKRKLDQNDDGQSRKTVFRQHWTDQEKDFLKELVLRNINANKRPLNNHDWAALSKEFNDRFKGWPIKIGEATTPHAKRRGVRTESSLVKKSHIMVERKPGAIKSQALRYEDLREEMDRALEAFGRSSTDVMDTEGDTGIGDGADDEDNTDSNDDNDDAFYHE
ncbi:hypothetical protein ONS95_014138 [Cadophora gregata]|uniref:uncharacterized protein n=1 Tax=Cadophora gregata TaxID=51156 RepID=UPI0026DD7617|nr:uncharacterized protein ONS95_014138 [Cadophora gregata]KAK0114652.1 hypothetical protein ONS95_014138 [Cadophora gregata]